MRATVQQPPQAAAPHRRSRWARFLIALVVLAAVAIAAVVLFAGRGRHVTAGRAQPSAPAATPAPASTAAGGAQPAGTLADGCLGGAVDLDDAVLTAQAQAPLTPAGAASFTATLIRWADTAPAPPQQAALAGRVLAGDATAAARAAMSSRVDTTGQSARIDFTEGRYLVESFDTSSDPVSASVSYLATGHVTDNGQVLDPALLAGTVKLVATDGHWHYQDLTGQRTIVDLQNAGTPYAEGC